jgi:Ca2+-binding RTX toxin-like protein
VTILGGSGARRFIGGSGSSTASLKGGTGNDTFVGGSGHDTMQAGSGSNLFEFFSATQSAYGGGAGGSHVIQGYTSTSGSLYVEGYSLAQLQTMGAIKVVGGNTVITLADKTSITLVGVKDLNAIKVTTSPI